MATTATVTLDQVLIQEVFDPANQLALQAASLGHTTTGPADTRIYGQGNVRRRSAPGVMHVIPITFELVTRAAKEHLLDWVAADTFLLLRDPRGGLYYGGLQSKSMQITELAAVDLSTIQVDFAAVTPPVGPPG